MSLGSSSIIRQQKRKGRLLYLGMSEMVFCTADLLCSTEPDRGLRHLHCHFSNKRCEKNLRKATVSTFLIMMWGDYSENPTRAAVMQLQGQDEQTCTEMTRGLVLRLVAINPINLVPREVWRR